jgi:hypothetical protein
MITASQIRNNFNQLSNFVIFSIIVRSYFPDFHKNLEFCKKGEDYNKYLSDEYNECLRKLNDQFIQINDVFINIIGEENIKIKNTMYHTYADTEVFIDGKFKFARLNSKSDWKEQTYIKVIPYYVKYLDRKISNEEIESAYTKQIRDSKLEILGV